MMRNMEVITVATLARIHTCPRSPLSEWLAVLDLTLQTNVLLCQRILMNIFTKIIFTVSIVAVSSPYACVETILWLVLSKWENYFQEKSKLLRNHTLWFTGGQARREAVWIQVQLQSKLQSSLLFCHLLTNVQMPWSQMLKRSLLHFRIVFFFSFREQLLLSCQ